MILKDPVKSVAVDLCAATLVLSRLNAVAPRKAMKYKPSAEIAKNDEETECFDNDRILYVRLLTLQNLNPINRQTTNKPSTK